MNCIYSRETITAEELFCIPQVWQPLPDKPCFPDLICHPMWSQAGHLMDSDFPPRNKSTSLASRMASEDMHHLWDSMGSGEHAFLWFQSWYCRVGYCSSVMQMMTSALFKKTAQPWCYRHGCGWRPAHLILWVGSGPHSLQFPLGSKHQPGCGPILTTGRKLNCVKEGTLYLEFWQYLILWCVIS